MLDKFYSFILAHMKSRRGRNGSRVRADRGPDRGHHRGRRSDVGREIWRHSRPWSTL